MKDVSKTGADLMHLRNSKVTADKMQATSTLGNEICLRGKQVLHQPSHVSVATIFEVLRYMYIRNALLIRLLKILRQPTTGFAFLGAHQVGEVPKFP
ncbi:hypothetical protein CSKR_112862 [Clonorchis sinensis]|uniref:Uncharacterized protein n=1 Tax=Clonorchis sinensis TaxID=79923 RepID=A0A3R7D939_CLOSI|nr:hypothetical protein CSKR_112862 [Clonorchis sinensis]